LDFSIFRLDQRQLGSDEAPPIGDRAAEPWPIKLSKYWSGCYHVSKKRAGAPA
jgi:hypothetical protein